MFLTDLFFFSVGGGGSWGFSLCVGWDRSDETDETRNIEACVWCCRSCSIQNTWHPLTLLPHLIPSSLLAWRKTSQALTLPISRQTRDLSMKWKPSAASGSSGNHRTSKFSPDPRFLSLWTVLRCWETCFPWYEGLVRETSLGGLYGCRYVSLPPMEVDGHSPAPAPEVGGWGGAWMEEWFHEPTHPHARWLERMMEDLYEHIRVHQGKVRPKTTNLVYHVTSSSHFSVVHQMAGHDVL